MANVSSDACHWWWQQIYIMETERFSLQNVKKNEKKNERRTDKQGNRE